MSEQEWLECTEPQDMLALLRDKASERKLRLFAVACCRRVWPLLNHTPSRRAIDKAEEVAGGDSGRDELHSAFLTVDGLFDPGGEPNLPSQLACVVCDDKLNAALVIQGIEQLLRPQGDRPRSRQHVTESSLQPPAYAGLLRDIFGNPFRSISVDPSWLTWKDGTVQKIAQAIYDECVFDRLPILADALEEAGCGHEEILNHLRGTGPHVRGCWALDLVVGKE